jgi:lipoprotein-anchoring transpeptidase ErfK/SrfK
MVTIGRTAFQHGRYVVPAISRARLCRAIATVAIVTVSAGPAFAQALSFAPAFRFDQPLSQYAPQQQDEQAGTEQLPAQFRRQMVTYPTNEPVGTIIIDTGHTFLYLTLDHGMAMRYGIGVGRQGFTWSGVETIVRKSEWPDWIPPAQMVARQPYLPRWVGGGPGNPLGGGRSILATPNIASTAPTIRPRSASAFQAGASDYRMPTSSISTIASASERKWSCWQMTRAACRSTAASPL